MQRNRKKETAREAGVDAERNALNGKSVEIDVATCDTTSAFWCYKIKTDDLMLQMAKKLYFIRYRHEMMESCHSSSHILWRIQHPQSYPPAILFCIYKARIQWWFTGSGIFLHFLSLSHAWHFIRQCINAITSQDMLFHVSLCVLCCCCCLRQMKEKNVNDQIRENIAQEKKNPIIIRSSVQIWMPYTLRLYMWNNSFCMGASTNSIYRCAIVNSSKKNSNKLLVMWKWNTCPCVRVCRRRNLHSSMLEADKKRKCFYRIYFFVYGMLMGMRLRFPGIFLVVYLRTGSLEIARCTSGKKNTSD